MKKAYTAVTSGLEGAGVIAWWAMDGRVDPDALEDALAEAGLDMSVPRTTMTAALAQAVRKHAGRRASREHGVFSVAGPRGSWFLVERALIDSGADLSLATLARVEIANDEVLVTPLNEADKDPSKADKLAICDYIAGAAEVCFMTTASSAISGWLSKTHTIEFGGVGLRAHGGFYFVPAAMRDRWETFWRVLSTHTGHAVSAIDAMPTEETISAVGAALRRESEATIAEMSKALAEAADTGLRTKSRNSALREVHRLSEKLNRYRDLLGTSLDDVLAAAEDIAVTIAVIPEV